jgi:hypothetical protein
VNVEIIQRLRGSKGAQEPTKVFHSLQSLL